MPKKLVRTREPLPVEQAQQSLDYALPDTSIARKPFYTLYIVAQDGLWVFVFNDNIRDKINECIIQNRKNRITYYVSGDVEFKEGIPVDAELLEVFRIRNNTKEVFTQRIVRSYKTPTVAVTAYYENDEILDLILLTVDLPNKILEERNSPGLATKAGLERAFLFWDTGFLVDLGYDPKKDDTIRCYRDDKSLKPFYTKHLKDVIDFCKKS